MEPIEVEIITAGLFITAIGIYGFFCFWIGRAVERQWWRSEMVERGHARYHFYDGKWYWNENVPKPSDPIAHAVRRMES